MTGEVAFVYGLILVVALLMASGRLRYDAIALLVVIALSVSGVLTVKEVLSGFGSTVVIMVAGLLVVGEMLERTGVAKWIGDRILTVGGDHPVRLLVLIMLAAAGLGAFMSSTAIVAIFIPIVFRVASQVKLNPASMLMPMAYAALISGMLTLIATSPNLVVSAELVSQGFAALGFFSFTPLGLAILVVGMLYVVFVGRRMLPQELDPQETRVSRAARSTFELKADYSVDENFSAIQIAPNSPVVGLSIAEAEMQSEHGVRILGVERITPKGVHYLPMPDPSLTFEVNDVLLALGREADKQQLASIGLFIPQPNEKRDKQWQQHLGSAEVMLHPESGLLGSTLREANFRSEYGLHVVGIRRAQEALPGFMDEKLKLGDTLFVMGTWKQIELLQTHTHEFVLLALSAEHALITPPAYRKMPLSLIILALMVMASVFNWVPLTIAVIIAAMLAVATRCLTADDAYHSIHWSSLVLVAGMLPLADALDQSGGTKLLVEGLTAIVGDASPYLMFTALFWLTAALGLILSTTASAVLVAPIAIQAAAVLGVSPYPLAMGVLIAASSAFASPVSTPIVTLVVEPGKYKFVDFMKVGIPLQVITYLVTLLVAPMLFPF